ncbi:SET domain-containing protein-lysine N-methyltransferase [Candidatus Pacearchaeota archaeon]|nr:SET domain-containing protein-lysine N-methyltransferase [Candidatus Pacearchaeota archaeon]
MLGVEPLVASLIFCAPSNAVKVIDDICEGGKTPNRKNILKWEEFAKTQPQIEIPVKHFIHGGMYGREIVIPKDSIITGQIYKFDHFDIMISGDITVSTDTGETKRLTGYNLFKGLSGKKRAGYVHEETTWITFHPVTGVNGDAIQEMITAKTFEKLEQFNIEMNRNDYKLLVNQTSMTESEIREQVENIDDICFDKQNGIYIDPSKIEGKGVYSRWTFKQGDFICLSRIGDKRTLAGRYTNHALYANSEMVVREKNVELTAIRDIEQDEEITVNYRSVFTERFNRGDLCLE